MNDLDKAVQNPCVRNCCLDENDICLGCFRTLEEIKHWQKSSNQERSKILQNTKIRRDSQD